MFTLKKINTCIFTKGLRFWWEANLVLDGKVIAECTMPGLAITHDDAMADAQRIAEIFHAEFVDETKEEVRC